MKSEKNYKNREWLQTMYEDMELEVWEIAEIGNTSVKMIHEWLQRFGFYSMDEDLFLDTPKSEKF